MNVGTHYRQNIVSVIRVLTPMVGEADIKMNEDMFNRSEIESMRNGNKIDVNGKRYGFCVGCNRIIRIDTPFFGDLHICAIDEEMR